MKVTVKQLGVDLEVKTKGMELDVSDSQGHIGDLYVSKKGLVWCRGKTSKEKGISLPWDRFIEMATGLEGNQTRRSRRTRN